MHNILFISGTTSTAGGQQRSLSLLCNGLVEKGGRNITLACLHGGQPYYPADERVRIICLDEYTKNRIAKVKYLIKIIKQSDFNLIIGYGFTTQILLGVLGLLFKTPIIYCERFYPFSGHDVSGNLAQSLGVFCMRGKNGVFQSSDAMRQYKKLKKQIVIPNILDSGAMPDVNDWPARKNVVINASRCVAYKNQAMLIRAFISAHKVCPNYMLKIYGEGELEDELKELINKNDAGEYISIETPSSEIFKHMNNAKIYVCSSDLKGEGYSNALLEAMGMGMACISTNCSGSVEDLIEDGKNGIIVPPGDEAAMTEALIRLMKNDDESRQIAEQAVNVRQTNEKGYIVSKWATFFEEVIKDAER